MALSPKRREEEKRIIKKRIKELEIHASDIPNKVTEQPHRLSKNRSFGCKTSNCKICHPHKQKKNRQTS